MPTLIDDATPHTTSDTPASTIHSPAAQCPQSTLQDLPTVVDDAAPDNTSVAAARTIPASAAPVAQRGPHDLLKQSALFQSSFQNRAASLIYSLWPLSTRPPRGACPDAAIVATPAPVEPPTVVRVPVVVQHPAADEVINDYTPGVEVGPVSRTKDNTRGAAVEDSTTIPTLEESLALASQRVWGVVLRDMQLIALLFLFHPSNFERKMLLVAKTGGGKSHVIRMIGTLLKGIHLIVHPLLVLTADQTAKFASGSDEFGQIGVHNLDEEGAVSREYRDRFTKYITGVDKNTSRTVYIFVSPQFIATHARIRCTLLRCARRGTLRSVTFDEAHLIGKQGATFRPEIRMISDTFFKPLFQNTSPAKRPFLVGTTATGSTNDIRRFEGIVRTRFPAKYRCWSSAHDFRQRSIKMTMLVGSDYSRHMNIVVDHLASSRSCAFIFLNSRSLVDNLTKSLETRIDKHPLALCWWLEQIRTRREFAGCARLGVFASPFDTRPTVENAKECSASFVDRIKRRLRRRRWVRQGRSG